MSFGESDTFLLNEIQRYGLMTVEAAQTWFPDIEPNAIVKRLARLVEALKLEKADYVRPRCYWHPYCPLGAQALPKHAALLNYCLLGGEGWQLQRWDRKAAVCVLGEKKEAVFVDLNATPDHVARKVARFCSETNLDGFNGITVLVPTPEKGNKVWRSVRKHELPLPVRCVAIDDLKELLGP